MKRYLLTKDTLRVGAGIIVTDLATLHLTVTGFEVLPESLTWFDSHNSPM